MATLEFKGKQFVYAHHLTVPFRPLVIDEKLSLPPKGEKPTLDDNLIIHADNLHGLKALVPTFAGAIDIIIIDPPYNTGEEGWCYSDQVNSPLMREWVKKNSPVDKEDLERHDKWMCMMWPRLQLLNELLSDDGLIAVMIDDNEVFHLGCLMDAVFGAHHRLACAPWQTDPSGGKSKGALRIGHEYVLIYRKGSEDSLARQQLETGELDLEDEIGKYRKGRELLKWGGASLREDREKAWYGLPNPKGEEVFPVRNDGRQGRWRWGAKHPLILQALSGKPVFHWERRPFDPGVKVQGQTERWVPYQKIRKESREFGWSTWLDRHGVNADGTEEIKAIFGNKIFDTPKPVSLLKWLIGLHVDDDAIVLDSFAGSGTTGHAVVSANQDDEGSRRFILVQMPEELAETHPAYKMGFRDVAHVTAERMRRVMKGYKWEGTAKKELYSRPMNFTALKKAAEILGTVEGVENLEGKDYDRVVKSVEQDTLKVTGEKKITEKVEGLGGSFTFCTLGDEITMDGLLSGKKMPDYESLAKYVFYTATGQTLAKVPKPKTDWFIGETENYRVHLIYRPDRDWLRGNEAMLDAPTVEKIAGGLDKQHKALVFAPAKFMSQRELTPRRVEFCQLPYAIYRILGD